MLQKTKMNGIMAFMASPSPGQL